MDIAFTPVENGLDYLKSAAEHLRDKPTERDLKYAVLHLNAAVEVLLKVRLMREHWSLVFTNPGKATHGALTTGDFSSIGMEDAITRLREIANVRLTDAARSSFKRLADVRNKLQHFGLVRQEPGVEALAGEVLDALLVFLGEELEPDASTSEQEILSEARDLIREEINRISALVDARMRRISNELDKNEDHLVTCPDCLKMTLALSEEGERSRCLFCEREWSDPEELADSYAGSVLHRSWYEAASGSGESPNHTCPECSLQTLVDRVLVRAHGDRPNWICFNCVFVLPPEGITGCLKCGEPIFGDEDSMTVCTDCFEYTVGRD